MKRIFVYLTVAVSAIVLAACSRERFGIETPEGTKLVLNLPTQKTFLGEYEGGKRPLYWSKGDSIAVNGVVSEPLAHENTDSLQSAQFTFKSVLSYPYSIAYPATIWNDASSVVLPSVAKYIPMIGYQAAEGSTTVKYLTSVMHFRVAKGTTDNCRIAYLQVSAEGVQMNGEFNVDFAEGSISSKEAVSAENNFVRRTINATPGDNAIDVFVPVTAGTYAATVRIVDSKGHYMDKTISSREFKKGQIHGFPAFAFEPTGTIIDIHINSSADWNAFATNFNDGKYDAVSPLVLSIDSDLDFTGLTPVSAGSYAGETYCSATVIGNNHIISNYTSGEPLIGSINTYGSVVDLTFDETCSFAPDYANGVKSFFGPFTDYLKGEIKNCVNKGNIAINAPTTGVINADKYCGGIAGRVREGKMISCKNYGTITSAVDFQCTAKAKKGLCVGGLVGWVSNPDGIVNSCENYGAITQNATADPLVAGGIAGICAGTIKNCTNEASIVVTPTRTSDDPCKNIYFGGILGDCNGAVIDSCANSGAMTSESNVKNQIIGGVISRVTKASAIGLANTNTGNITANKNGRNYYFGGIIGNIGVEGTYTFTGNPNTGKIVVAGMEAGTNSSLYLGGLVGRVSAAVTIQGQDLESGCDITFNASAAANQQTSFTGVGGILGGTMTEDCAPTILDCKVSGTTGIAFTASTSYTIAFAIGGAGGILGQSSVGATIKNCNVNIPIKFGTKASAKVTTGERLDFGGIAGCIYGGDSEISNCNVGTGGILNRHYNNNGVSATTGNATGGIIGSFGHVKDNTNKIIISGCTNAGDVWAYRCCAGCVAGYLDNASVTNCSSTGALSNGNYAGGIVGYASNSSFSGCTFNNANGITSTDAGSCYNYAGGLAGQTVASSFTNCSTYFGTGTGVKAAGTYISKTTTFHGCAPGSLIGNSDASTTITNCKAGGKLQAATYGMPDDADTKSATLDETTVVSYAIGNCAMDPAPTADNVTLWDGK